MALVLYVTDNDINSMSKKELRKAVRFYNDEATKFNEEAEVWRKKYIERGYEINKLKCELLESKIEKIQTICTSHGMTNDDANSVIAEVIKLKSEESKAGVGGGDLRFASGHGPAGPAGSCGVGSTIIRKES